MIVDFNLLVFTYNFWYGSDFINGRSENEYHKLTSLIHKLQSHVKSSCSYSIRDGVKSISRRTKSGLKQFSLYLYLR